MLIESSTVSGNNVSGANSIGGAIAAGTVTANNSTVSENTASGFNARVGGIDANSVVLSNSTVTGNHADFAAGGLLTYHLNSVHSIVAGNTADAVNPDLQLLGSHSSAQLSFSLIGSNSGTPLVEAPVGSPDANGNLIGGPVHGVIDPKLGPLADNGGFTLPDGSHILTQALLAGSPAINAGDLNAVAGQNGVPEFDERGTPFGRVFGGRIDIGAFEYQAPSDLNLLVDTLVDESDGNYARGDLSLREAIELANLYPGADTIHFDPALTAGGPAKILLTQGELKITDSLTIDGPGRICSRSTPVATIRRRCQRRQWQPRLQHRRRQQYDI